MIGKHLSMDDMILFLECAANNAPYLQPGMPK